MLLGRSGPGGCDALQVPLSGGAGEEAWRPPAGGATEVVVGRCGDSTVATVAWRVEPRGGIVDDAHFAGALRDDRDGHARSSLNTRL